MDIQGLLRRLKKTLDDDRVDSYHRVKQALVLLENGPSSTNFDDRIRPLFDSLRLLRAMCNDEIKRTAGNAYRNRPGGDIINPPIPFNRLNELLKLCDGVFKESDKIGAESK